MHNQLRIFIGIELLSFILLVSALALLFIWQLHYTVFLVLMGFSVILSILSKQYQKRKKMDVEVAKTIKELFSLPLYVIPLILFVIVSFYVYPTLRNGISSKSWQVTEGTILKNNKKFSSFQEKYGQYPSEARKISLSSRRAYSTVPFNHNK